MRLVDKRQDFQINKWGFGSFRIECMNSIGITIVEISPPEVSGRYIGSYENVNSYIEYNQSVNSFDLFSTEDSSITKIWKLENSWMFPELSRFNETSKERTIRLLKIKENENELEKAWNLIYVQAI